MEYFLSTNPFAVAYHHGFDIIRSSVFVVKVSQNIIKISGGLHRHDQASEVLIPKDIWQDGLINKEIFILGKMPESKVENDMNHYVKTMFHNSYDIESKFDFENQDED